MATITYKELPPNGAADIVKCANRGHLLPKSQKRRQELHDDFSEDNGYSGCSKSQHRLLPRDHEGSS